jgi:glycosyltransferase involved in cell wall biosynthesis
VRKKILFIDDDQERNGSTVSLEYLVQGFYEKDYEVSILSWKVNEFASAVLRPYAKIVDGRRWYLPSISLAAYFTYRASFFSFQGLKNSLKDFIKLIVGLFVSYCVIADIKPDIVYLNEYRVLPAAIAAKLLKIPTVTHIRSRFWEPRFFIRRYLLAKGILKYCDVLIAITRQEKLQFQPYSSKDEMDKIFVIGEFFPEYVVEAATIAVVKHEHRLPTDKKIVVMLGGIRYLKGTKFFLQAAEIISELRKDVIFVVVGVHDVVYEEEDPHYYEQCIQIIEKLKKNHNSVYAIGRILNPLDIIAASDILVSPYVEDHFSRPIVEAWGEKKPVIAVKTKYTIDFIEDTIDGILVDRDDCQGMVKALNALLDDDAKRIQMGEAGRRKVAEEFEFKKNINRIINICDSNFKVQ